MNIVSIYSEIDTLKNFLGGYYFDLVLERWFEHVDKCRSKTHKERDGSDVTGGTSVGAPIAATIRAWTNLGSAGGHGF